LLYYGFHFGYSHNMEKYKQNLKVDGDNVYSYDTLVAIKKHPYLVKLRWNVGGRTTSPTTSKHINYVAREFGLEVLDYDEYNFKSNLNKYKDFI